jgi:hypothetical protein
VRSSTRFRPWLPSKSAFAEFLPAEVIVVAARWYPRYAGASLRVQGEIDYAAASLRAANGLAVYDRPAVQASGSTVAFGLVAGRFTATVIWLFDSSLSR